MDTKPTPQGPNMMNMNMGMGGVGTPSGADGAQGGPSGQAPGTSSERRILNTYIYEYFLKHDMLDCAKAMLKAQADVAMQSDRAKHENMNGVDDPMDTGEDSRNENYDEAKSVRDLPSAAVSSKAPQTTGGGFLLEWWQCFMDIYFARNRQGSQLAQSYVTQQRIRQEQILRMAPQQMGAPHPQYAGRMMPNGAMDHSNPELMKQRQMQRVMAGAPNMGGRPGQPMGMNPRTNMLMQRSDSEVNEMNGENPRPQSPAASGSSPGQKRIRLENGHYQPVGPNGRGQPPNQGGNSAQTAQNAHQLLVANGINPAQLTSQQFQTFQTQPQAMQQRSIALYAQSIAQATKQSQMNAVMHAGMQGGPKGIHPGQSGSPMMPQTSEGGIGGGGTLNEFYQPGHGGAGMRPGGAMGGAGGTQGNHALQDYQMQLMLLEQQNKKRLLLARQEQGEMQPGHAETRGPGGFPQGMSPNSRANPSPGPNGKPPGQMAGTPKMGNQGGPGSPVPDGQIGGHIQQRSSPASTAGFNGAGPGGIPEGAHPNIMYNDQMKMGMGMANGQPTNMMRPPYNGQMGIDGQPMNPNIVRQQGAGRGQHPGGAMWQGGQPGAQMPVGQPGAPGSQPGQPGGPGGQQQQPGGGQPNNAPTPQQVGTPQQARQGLPHGNMAPPQAPGPNAQAGNRQSGAPASPQVSNQQPPTPTQGGKVAAGKKAGNAKNAKRTAQAKKAAAGGATPNTNPAGPASAVTPSATSEPLTPTTPSQNPAGNNNNSGGNNFPQGARPNFPPGNNGAPPNQNQPGAPPGAPPPQQQQDPNQQQQQQQQASMVTVGAGLGPFDADMIGGFDPNGFAAGGMGGDESLLDNFDFDSFLTSGDGDGALGFSGDGLGWGGDGLEAGAGEG